MGIFVSAIVADRYPGGNNLRTTGHRRRQEVSRKRAKKAAGGDETNVLRYQKRISGPLLDRIDIHSFNFSEENSRTPTSDEPNETSEVFAQAPRRSLIFAQIIALELLPQLAQ